MAVNSSFNTHVDAMAKSIAGRRVVPPIPSKRVVEIPDAVEREIRDDRRAAASSWSAMLHYVDAKGTASMRRITVHRIVCRDGELTALARCHERNANRSFSVANMVELVCCETGEVLEPQRHFEWLRETGALPTDDKMLAEVVKIARFLALCDGDYHPLEQEAIEHTVERYCLRFGGSDRMCRDVLDGMSNIAPDDRDMVLAIERIGAARQSAQLARFVLQQGAEVVQADGRIDAEEHRWALEMSNALKALCI